MTKYKKILCGFVMVFLLSALFSTTAFAAGTGDVAGAIESTWTDASDQIKAVVNNVVFPVIDLATVYKGNIIKNLIMDCQSYTKYRPNETTGGIFVSWRRKEELPTGA